MRPRKPGSAVFRAALVGCGRIGSTFADDQRVEGIYSHAEAYSCCPSTQLVAVCDADEETARRCAARWDVAQAFTGLSRMLEETTPELVSVCTPDHTHAAVLNRILDCDSVKGILAEKPLALDLTDAESVVQRAHDRGVVLAVNYTRRYTSGHIAVRQRIASGEIGEIQSVSGRYTKGVLHNGTHWIDLARWLVGEVISVRAYSKAQRERDMDLDVHFRFDNGVTGSLLVCEAEAFSIFEMDIVGTSGRIFLYDSGHRAQRWEARDSLRYSGYRSLVSVEDDESDMRDSTLNAVRDLAACVANAGRPRCDGTDAVAALRIGAIALQSAVEEREISSGMRA
ncbi:MAG: Gfo/Idh/MocA family oxidoreductase [Vicinamibacterales bacterium]